MKFKYIPYESLKTVSASFKKNNEVKLVAINGCFDKLDASTARHLINCRAFGNVNCVLIYDDISVNTLMGEGFPTAPLLDRILVLELLEVVDLVIPINYKHLAETLTILEPYFWCPISDGEVEKIEKDIIVNKGIKFIPPRTQQNKVAELLKELEEDKLKIRETLPMTNLPQSQSAILRTCKNITSKTIVKTSCGCKKKISVCSVKDDKTVTPELCVNCELYKAS